MLRDGSRGAPCDAWEERSRGLGVNEGTSPVARSSRTVEGLSELLAKSEAPIWLVPFAFKSFLEKEQARHEGEEEYKTGHEIWQGERVSPEILDVLEDAAEQTTLDWASKEATECWSKYRTDAPD